MWGFRRRLSGPGWLGRAFFEQCDLEIGGLIDQLTVRLQPAVRDTEHQLGPHHPLDIDSVDDFLGVWANLTGKLYLTDTDRTAVARGAEPAEKEADHLPQRI